MSFSCPHCHNSNNEIQSGAMIQDSGVRYTLCVQSTEVHVGGNVVGFGIYAYMCDIMRECSYQWYCHLHQNRHGRMMFMFVAFDLK